MQSLLLASVRTAKGETDMGKYRALWEAVQKSGGQTLTLTFEEIETLSGVPIDHSFLTYKKELLEYGYAVAKISLKNRTVAFKKI